MIDHKTPFETIKEAALKLPDEVKAKIMFNAGFGLQTKMPGLVHDFNQNIGLRNGPSLYMDVTYAFFQATIAAINEQEGEGNGPFCLGGRYIEIPE